MPKEWNTPGGTAPRLYLDILAQPHTLIAGTTGSGKSCVINGIIYTALYRSPASVRFILIDPKRRELCEYQTLPHTLIYTHLRGAVNALEWTAEEVNRRYDRMTGKQSAEADIYIIIDELSDLLLTYPEAVKLLSEIAMIGRAANVHIIAGTQCPNRKTLSAEFAANCPARLGLRCRDPIESRQIIGCKAAISLPLHGYAYYVTPALMSPQLVKLPYYTDNILSERVRWWTAQK